MRCQFFLGCVNMRHFLYLFVTFSFLLTLTACGSKEAPVVQEKEFSADAGQTVGYRLLEPDYQENNLIYISSTVTDNKVAQVNYNSGDSTVTLCMTLDETRFHGLAGFQNSAYAGGIETPGEAFSPLDIRLTNDTTYFCEFSFTYDGHTCYLSLSQTNTDLSRYSDLLIRYVDQLYVLDTAPDFVYALDPTYHETVELPPMEEEPQPEDPQIPTLPTLTLPNEDEEQDEDGEEDKDDEDSPDSAVLTVDYTDLTLVHIGDSYTFTVTGGDGTYTWSTVPNTVAKVSEDGTVTAIGPGTATLICTSGDDRISVTVRVKG